jgi:hypothetical protein
MMLKSLPSPHKCSNCGGKVTWLWCANQIADPLPTDVHLCVRCIRLMLCRIAIIRHEGVGMSNEHNGHEARMMGYVNRISGRIRPWMHDRMEDGA